MRYNDKQFPTYIIVTHDFPHFRAISPLHPVEVRRCWVKISQPFKIADRMCHLAEVLSWQ